MLVYRRIYLFPAKPKMRVCVCILCLLLQTVYAAAQRDYHFQNFSEKDGLSSNVVTAIAEDGNGLMWFGSYSGLMRYDGYSFTVFYSGNDSLSLRGNFITALRTDKAGNLWIATESSVCKYDIKTETFRSYPSLINGKLEKYYQADYVFTLGDGTIRYFAERMYQLDTAKQYFVPIMDEYVLPRKIKFCHHTAQDNFLMVSPTGKAMYYTDRDGHEIAVIDEDFANGVNPYARAYEALETEPGKIYIGGDNGLFAIDTQAQTIRKIDQVGGKRLPAQIASLWQDKNGELWIGSNGGGLFIMTADQQDIIQIESDPEHPSYQKLNSLTVLEMYEDSRHILWLGTWNGLSYITTGSKGFNTLGASENAAILPSAYVASFAYSPDGMLAIGFDGGGIAFWDTKSDKRADLKTPDKTNHMPNLSVLALAYDSKGNLYTGGYKHPLHRFAPDRKSDELYACNPDDPDALSSDFIRDIYIEDDTLIWVLTNGGGLSSFNPDTKKFKRVTTDANGTAPCSQYGICITEDNNKTLIVGTYNGLYTYNYRNNIIHNYRHNDTTPQPISHNWVYSVYRDSQGRIWAGTCSGLNLFNQEDGTFTVYDEAAGFANTVCSAITEDNNGYLWVTTACGVAKFSPEDGTVTRIYDKKDGLPTNNFSHCASLRTPDGMIYLGSNAGMVYFDPEKIKVANYIPKPVVTKLLINYKPVTVNTENSPLSQSTMTTKEITLTSRQSTFTIQFASLGYDDAPSYTYAYRIASYDKGWNDVGTRREIDFTKLEPGTYTIALRAQNHDGVNSEINSFTVIVLPPWYKTIFARIAYVLLVCIAVLMFIHARTKNLKRQKQRLENEVAQRTREISEVNSMLEQRNQELHLSSEEITSQRDLLYTQNLQLQNALQTIRFKNHAIQSSITYAQTIQAALLTKETDFYKYFQTSFVYRPKDIVSGDFFWMKHIEDDGTEMFFLSVIDCTGHGVPGAFMSIIANSVLNEIVDTAHITAPNEILGELSFKIATLLAQDLSDNKDGMDMALCRIDRKMGGEFEQATFAGAKNPLYLRKATDDKYRLIPASRKSIAGGLYSGQETIERTTFEQTTITLAKGDTFYMTSDGVIDLGNKQRRRFTRNRLLDLLNTIYPLDMDCQAAEIEKTIVKFAEGTEQRDDISVLGIRI